MAKTYKVTKTETEEFIVETSTASRNRTYQKEWLVEEIARLQELLDKFKK